MPLRYLVGPVTSARARDWQAQREAGNCLAFNAEGTADVRLGHGDTWEAVLARLPGNWRPDFVLLDLGYVSVPAWLWQTPVPLVALAPDWQLQWHALRRLLPLTELVLTDQAGVAALHREGIGHACAANLFGLQGIFTQAPAGVPSTRDIDILFVGNLHPAVQRERLPWLGRLARQAGSWRVVIAQGVRGEDYRRLLLRSRIVFNRSVRGEWNLRVGEACSCGALLLQEAGNLEMAGLWEHARECAFYDDSTLEPLLDFYLRSEGERRAVAERGRHKAAAFTFAALWEKELDQIERRFDEIHRRFLARPSLTPEDALLARTWLALGAADGGDPTLDEDLGAALAARGDPRLHNARGLVAALACRDGRGRYPAENLRLLARQFHAAAKGPLGGAMASLNLVEALLVLGQKALAVQGARDLLDRLLHGPAISADLDSGHFPPAYDLFRVEWERAAWQHAGAPAQEVRAKAALLRWRLHSLLADLTGELAHFHEAALARPDLPPTRAALGCALARARRPADAVAHLQAAVDADPFDRGAARALFQALTDAGQGGQAEALKQQQVLLHVAAPTAVPAEGWFMQPHRGQGTPGAGAPLALLWEGAFLAQHSLGLVNRELCKGLIRRGHELSLLPVASPGTQIEPGPLRELMRSRLIHPLSRPEDACVRLSWPPRWQSPARGRWVVCQPWEFGSIPRDWLAPLRSRVDEVWVPTAFVRDGFVADGVPAGKVHVMPLGVDEQTFRPGLEPWPLPTQKRFKLLFVGGTIARKGIGVLLRAYGRAFSRHDDVCLVVKDMGVGSFYRGQTAEGLIAEFRASSDNPELLHLDESLTEPEIARLYGSCDALVAPYRGEGFCLPALEAMACGLPVIVTGYGAALDFCDEGTAALIPARVVHFPERRVGDLETVRHPWLAEPDEDALVELLRRAVECPDVARGRAEEARRRVLAGWTWGHAVALVEGRLLALREGPAGKPGSTAAAARAALASASPDEGVADVPVYAPAPTHAQTARPKVSACIIVKNEEHNIAACLASVAGLCDDVVVVDTGSADRTKEIALAHGARVFDFPWVDSFSAARNESLRHARGEWVFWLDADDRLDEDNREKLKALFASLPPDYVAYSMKCRCLPDPASGVATVVDHIRLFRNDPRIRWRYRIHEQILPAVREAGGRVEFAGVTVQHTGYSDPALRRRKLQRDLRLLEMERGEQPHDPFTLFNLGATYADLGRYAEALPLLQESLARSHPRDSIVRKLFALTANCLMHLGRPDEALQACARGQAVCPDDQELLFLEGLIRTDQDDLHGAHAALVRLLGTHSEQHFASVADGLRGHRGRHQLAVVCCRLGEHAEAEAMWRAVLRERPGFVPAHVGLGEMLLALGRWPELHEVSAALEGAPGGELDAVLLRGKAHLARREFAQARALLDDALARQPDSLPLLVLLTHVLLQEDRDHAGAERVLMEVLRRDPNHAQARHNLQVLRQRRQG
jgi:glycosyltransferase involved in cell wall biosynthesis/tetratricopeptide (TPR) repeat protein